MKSIYTPAHSRTNIPEGFCLVKNILNNRYYYKCNQTIFIKGEIRDCKFVIRSDKYKNNITHGCIFEKLIIPTQKDINIQRIREKFLLALVNVIGHCNISINTARSSQFRKFCNRLITIGVNISLNGLAEIDLNKLLPSPSFYKIRKTFVNQSNIKKEKN